MRRGPAQYFALSNALSYLSLVCGIGAVIAARELKNWEVAGLLIGVSALADTFDGKFAGLFRRTELEKAFGVQLDSLVDAVSFGVVPVLCLNALVPIESRILWVAWTGAAALYVLCGLTRLGFYNLHQSRDAGFVGLPTTLAGLIWSTVFLFHPSLLFTISLLIGIGLAMVSFLPIPRPRGITMAVYMSWVWIVLVSHGVLLARHS